MHELLLLAQVPSSRHTQLLNILAGVSAMQPVPVLEKHLVFKPNRQPSHTEPVQVGAAQDVQKQLQAHTQGDVFYVQVVGEADREDGGNETDDHKQREGIGAEERNGNAAGIPENEKANRKSLAAKWTIQFRDLPEVVRQRPVTSRLIADIPVISGDPADFMKAMDYSHTSSYYLSAHRFSHLNTSLLLYRTHRTSGMDYDLMDITKDVSHTPLLDPSGTYLLQAGVKVQDGSKVEIMNKGMNELLNLKETLKGVVNLDVGDRLAMDTRVK